MEALIILAVLPARPSWGLGPAPAATTCDHDVTVAAPAGVVTMRTVLADLPPSGPVRFRAWVRLVGRACNPTTGSLGRATVARVAHGLNGPALVRFAPHCSVCLNLGLPARRVFGRDAEPR